NRTTFAMDFPPPLWLLPPAMPPWSTVLSVAWVSTCPLFKAIPWITTPPTPPWTFLLSPLPGPCIPPKPPPSIYWGHTVTFALSLEVIVFSLHHFSWFVVMVVN
ncbi:hypothetical protein M9458_001703, partial [Cirrhinus mrigala]